MGRISFLIERCNRCKMHLELCVCAHIPIVDVATKVVLVMHKREVVKVSATGPLALECLPNSELHVHGHRNHPVHLGHLLTPQRRVLCLFPRPGAQILDDAFVSADPRPVTLIVPDGNWGQASRMSRRIPGMKDAINVILPKGQPTGWGLRHESHEDGLATFEAISRALGIIESPDAQKSMDALFALMVQRTHRLRGNKQG
ncbi:MAG: DTW domain-containing protein [Deltaproteobacteria bacterium]|nr:DTW domain-containing protein [Deltaproteobacteria bacterium]